MQELIEIVEDLKMIAVVGTDSPGMDHIMEKWQLRLEDAEADMEKQFSLDLI